MFFLENTKVLLTSPLEICENIIQSCKLNLLVPVYTREIIICWELRLNVHTVTTAAVEQNIRVQDNCSNCVCFLAVHGICMPLDILN